MLAALLRRVRWPWGPCRRSHQDQVSPCHGPASSRAPPAVTALPRCALTASKCAAGHCKVSEGDKEQCLQRQEGEDTIPSAGQRCPGCLSFCRTREGWEQGEIPDIKTRLLTHLLTGELQTYKGKPQKGEGKEWGK